MVFTVEEKRERKKIRDKKYREKNKEKIKIRDKNYREKNKEKIKQYRDNNKEYFNEYNKKYFEKNKEYFTEYNKKYSKTPQGIKSVTISSWKHRGLIYEDYDSLYGHYLNATNCDECGVRFGKFGGGVGDWKCMDHCHETGAFRNFLCNDCNVRRR